VQTMTYQIIKKSKGKEYLCEVESYRENGKVRQRIVKYHGSFDKPSNQLIHKQDLSLERKSINDISKKPKN
jgi:hypothetical protein